MPRNKPNYTTIAFREVLQRYREVAPLGGFFSPQETGRYNSRMPNQGYRSPDGPVFFCTSEAMNDRTPRRYTVRRMDWDTGEIVNVGPFCELDRNAATNIARIEAQRYRYASEYIL